MDIITMKSEKLKIIEIKKKTTAKMFKDLKVGDVLQFSTEVKDVGRGYRGRTYATDIKVVNITTGDKVNKTFNQTGFIYGCFEFEVVGDV